MFSYHLSQVLDIIMVAVENNSAFVCLYSIYYFILLLHKYYFCNNNISKLTSFNITMKYNILIDSINCMIEVVVNNIINCDNT